jgi:hypothetical protein
MLVTYVFSPGMQWGVCCIVYVLDFLWTLTEWWCHILSPTTVCRRFTSYYSTSASVPVIWRVMLLVSFVLSRLGGRSADTLWYPGSSMMTCTVSSLMKIHWQGKSSPVFVLTLSFWTCRVFFGLITAWGCSCLGVSVIQFLPTQNIQSQFTAVVFGTQVAPCIGLSMKAAWHPSIPRNWIVILRSCLGGFTDWYDISKLCCSNTLNGFQLCLICWLATSRINK